MSTPPTLLGPAPDFDEQIKTLRGVFSRQEPWVARRLSIAVAIAPGRLEVSGFARRHFGIHHQTIRVPAKEARRYFVRATVAELAALKEAERRLGGDSVCEFEEWVCTHLATGFKVAAFLARDEAEVFCGLVDQVVDWSAIKAPGDVEKLPKDARRAVGGIAEAIRRGQLMRVPEREAMS